jgi:hypothetical protein
MDTEVKKFVERSIKRGDSLAQIKSTLVSYGWEENVNEATGYYDEFKKKSPAGTGLRAAGVSPSRQTVTPSSSGFASQETKNIPLEDPLLTKKDGYAKSLMEQLNLAAKDKNNRNKYVPTINKLWNEYSSIDRGAPTPLSLFEDNGAISKNSLNLLNESSARNAERMKREAIAIAKDDNVLESGVRSLWAGLLGTANYLGDLVDPDSYDDVPDAKTDLEKEAEAQSARAQKASYGRKLLAGYTDKQIEDGFYKNFADGNVATALGLFGRDVVELLPQVAANAIPYVGLPALAASAGGQAWLKIKDDEKYNTLEKFLYAPLVGAAEYFTEKFFGMDRKMIQEGLSKAFGKTITSAADIPKKELGDMIFGTLPKAVRAPLEEGFEESLVSTFTQTLDKIMAEKPFDPVEIAESAMLGAGAGGSTYALVRGSSALLQTPLFSDVYKITNTAANIDNILKSKDISDEERVILTDRLNGYKTQMRKLQDGASEYYKQFSQEDKQKTLELNQTISRGIRSYSTMKTAEAKAETVNRIKQSLAEKAQIEQKYDSAQKQQVPSPVVQGAQPGGVPVQGTGTETPQAGGVLQVPSQQEEKVAEAAKQPNVGFRPTKASLTSQTLPQILSNLKSYVESIPEETLQKFETTRQSITNGFESVANVISSFAKESLNVEVEAINTEDEWNKATMDPTTGKPEKLSRGLYYQRGQEGAPSKIILFAPALLGNTVYHEGIHEIVPQAFGQEGINKVAKALASGIKRDPGLNAKFGNFLSQYEQGDKNEELLAELGAMVAAGDIDVEITKSLATRFMEAVASVLGAVGIKMAPNSSQLSEAFLSYSQKLGAGAKLDIQKTAETKEEGDKKGPKRQAVGLRTKEESLAEFGFPVGDKVTNIRQVGAALEKRQQKKYIKIAKNDTSDKAKDIISNYMVDEVIFELESLGESSAKGWYGEKFQKALDLLSESIPSLKDKGNRNLFTMLVAITSDGQKVINNFTYAISLYNSYLKDGVVSDKFNFGGDRNSGMKINVGNINRLIKQYGNDFVAINDFLLQTDSYGNIKKKYNIKKSDYKVTTTMPISAGVFGPKLGAFFANLSGQENYLTMDRWWSRTFNRYRGILLPTVKEQGKQKFLNAIGKPNISNNAFLKEVKKYADSYIKKKYKNGTAIEKAANTIYKAAFVELNDKPFNAGDRDMMIETTQVAQEKLKKAGYDLSMADIQAILWYFEKRLYAEIQSKKSAMDVDYSNAVTKLIEGKKDLSFLPNEVSKIVNVKESEDEYVDAISSPSSNIIQLDEAVDLAAVDKATETINNAQKRKTPKRQGFEGKQSATFVRELDIAITPATTERKFDKVTARIKSLSEKYDRLVKESEKGIDNSEEINNVASQILDAARKQLAARISKVKGASVKFDDDFRGLYNNVFEPSFNLKLRLTPQSNENEVSQILNEFAERYTQDAFIVETASEESEDFRKQLGENVMPLGDYDEKTNMSHFPQLYAEFTSPLSDKELNELSLSLREGGIDGFSLNKKELKITIFPFLTEEQEKLSEDEQRRIKKEYYDEQISSARKAMANVSRVGRDVKSEVRFRKSTYKGAKSTEGATRQYDRDNFLKAHKDGLTKYELLAKEFNKLRLEEIELSKKKEKLPNDKQKRYDEIKSVIQPIIQDTIALNEPFYKEAKREIERIASSVSRNLRGAFVSRFNIKRPERASIKVMRWYNSDIEDLGDGARVNIIVDNEQQADRLFNEIDKKNPSKNPDRERRVNETTDLGYPKRLIEMDTKNGFIGEIQIMTPEGYLAKDGVDYFDDNQQDFARKRLKEVQNRLGWAIPDGIGHYFYEINRDENINDELRERAKALSLSYYKAFTNPSFKLSESEFTKELAKFKEDVDKADKSTWDEGNSGKSPKTLDTYLEESGKKEPKESAPTKKAMLQIIGSNSQMKEWTSKMLLKANEMERRGVKPKTIFNVTGWERGADKKWRYPVPTFKLNYTKVAEFNEGPVGNTVSLYDLVENKGRFKEDTSKFGYNRYEYDDKGKTRTKENEDVFDFYPEFANMKVTLGPSNGSTFFKHTKSPGSKGLGEITMSKDWYNKSPDHFFFVLVHEIQHAVQREEGFAVGGSASTVDNEIDEVIKANERILKNKDKIVPALKENIKEQKKRIKWYIDQGYSQETMIKDGVLTTLDGLETQVRMIDDVEKQLNLLKQIKAATNLSSVEKYRILSGEVEADNAARRAAFQLAKGSLATQPLIDTEEIPREYQLIITPDIEDMSLPSFLTKMGYPSKPKRQDILRVAALKDVESTAKALEEKYSAQPIKRNDIINNNPQEIYALSIGINPSNLSYLGKGDFGKAYSTDIGTVIKITSSANEAEIALSLIGKKGNHAEIYDVKKVENEFIIHQEELDTYSEIEDNLQTVENILSEQELPIQYLDYLDYDELSQESKDEYDSLSNFISDLEDINGLYRNLGIEASDLQSGNLGYDKNGKLKAFDLQDKSSKIKSKDVNADALKDKNQVISEAYHEAKKDGSNPELVKAVEDLLVGEQQQPKRQGISKAQGPLIPIVYNSLLQQSTRNADGTNTPPYTLQEWLTMMTPYLNAQTATAIYNGVARNKPPFTAPSIQDAYDSSKKRMEAGKNKAFFTWNNLKKYFIDRQAELKKAILASGMKNAYNYLVNKAGSGARAAYFYYEKEKDIYKDLKKEQIEKLDQIIMLRRIIEIDSNFDERGEARPKHTNGFNKGYAEMELSRLQSELGDAAYNDLNNRATKYFDAFRSLLDSMYEEGLVSEELYEQLRDIDYQPRLFLDHVFEMDEPSMREMNLSAAQIKRIKEGSEGDIMFDSRFLLALYAKSAFSKIARNKANKEIAKATEAQGNESWVSKTDKPGFSEVTYFEDGVKKSFYLKDNLKSELDDISRVSGMPQNIQKLIGMVTGSFAVKLLATRANPLFVAKNVPRDYLHVLFFTKAYDNMSLPLAAMRLAGDFIKGVKSKLQDDQDFKDFVEFGGGMDFLSTEGMESMITNRTVTNKIIEKLGKAGELSEIGFRLAMYKKFKEDGMKALGPNATEDEVTRVKVQAVTQAREMIDFSQGGIATKNLEIVSPYINSAFQGFRVSTSYIQNNPKEFAKKLGYLSIGVMMLALYNAMLGDDDMEDIPEETKRKYFIIMTPFTFEEDGKTKRHYVKIAKTQQLAPFIAGLELTSDYFVAGVMGRKPRESKDAYEYAWKGATMYFPKDPSNIKKEISSSVPLFAAIAAYDMNYDTYRERAVSMDYNQVLPQDEDFTNKQVPYFYKALAQGIGASGGEAGPKRLQVATEKFVTTPYSSLLTMGAYTILDSFSRLFELKGPGGIPVKDQAAISNSVSKSLGLSASKVFTGATEPDWRSYTRKEEIERINMEEKSERRGIKIAAQNIGQKYFEASNAKDSKAMSEARKEYQDELMRIKKESGVPDAKYFMDAFQQARKYGKATNPEYNDISYAASNEAKARIIMEYGGRTMSRKELVEYINDYKRKTGKPINGSEILREYQKETGYGK